MTMCCCYGIEENACLIHSSTDSKGKPWPAYVQESGDAPSDVGDGYTFTTPGKIRFDHDPIKHWDGTDFVSGRSSFAGKDRKRLIGIIQLDSDDSCVEITVMDDGVEYCKLKFVVHTPFIAKYPIISVLRNSKRNNSFTDGIEISTNETILDKWQAGYQIKFYAGSEFHEPDVTGIGSPVNAISPLTPVFISSSTENYFISSDTWSHDWWDSTDTYSIWIECISGSVSVSKFELYHDAFQFNTLYYDPLIESDGPGCLTSVSFPVGASYSGVGLCNARGDFLRNTIPGSLSLTLPTLSVNPDAVVFASTCDDCTRGGGDVVRLMINPEDSLVFEIYCQFQSNEAPVACNETEYGVNFAKFYPWFTNEGAGVVVIDYEQDGDSEVIGADIETLPGPLDPFAYPLAYTDGDQVIFSNASVVLDHIGRSNLIVWQEWKNNLFGCMLAHGERVNIELEDGAWSPA